MFKVTRFISSIFIFTVLLLSGVGCGKNNNILTTPEPTAIQPGPAIHEIQGSKHLSPMMGRKVENVEGVVTAFRGDGFYMQDLNPDLDPATSEGIFVFTQLPPRVQPGMIVAVTGVVREVYPGGAETGNLSITQITTPSVVEITSENPLPTPVIIGSAGIVPPSTLIDNDQMTLFDPSEDGIDFYESMESMLVQVNNPVVVGPTNAYKEIAIVGDDGENAGLMNPRGTIILREGDYNPERILLDDSLRSTPNVNVGDHFDQAIVGVVDYSYGNFKLQPIVKLTGISSNLERESARPAGDDELSIASYNVENLDALDAETRFSDLARNIVENLQSPDIVCLVEVQDNNGPFADEIVDADATYEKIINAIAALNGPEYQYRDIAPVVNQDGGEEGGNIRVGFLFRTDRGLRFIDKQGGDAHTPVELLDSGDGVGLSFSPGRIDPVNSAFIDSRKPLVGEFEFRGKRFFVIANHFNSKGGDTYLYGDQQPPFLASENQRLKQAAVVNAFVKKALSLDPDVRILVIGDLNDFQFSKPIQLLMGDEMTSLVMTLPEEERYTYNYDGNAQVLDHILVTNRMMEDLTEFDIVHINSEYFYGNKFSDHDPVLARFIFD